MRTLFLWALCLVAALPAAAYTVVIDAGHGGKDHGAIDNGVREKDINLGVAREIAAYLRKHYKDVKVVLTRDKDVFLSLQQRADVANKAKGDLFVSIHTNSVAETNPNRRSVAGATTYTLGLHKDAANQEVARRENSVITYENNYDTKYEGFDPASDESYIIFEMAQKANLAQSVKFADAVQQQMSKVAKRRDRGVHQAGFWVLWATSMPAALVELDFICNPNSAKYLASESGQEQIGKAIGIAIGDYFTTLAKHEKARLRSEESDAEESMDPSQGVVLAAAPAVEKKSAEAPGVAVPAERTRRPATRRRRSEASRAKSCDREYEEAVIPERVEYVADASTVTTAPEQTTTAQPAAPAGNKKDKKADRKGKQPSDKKGQKERRATASRSDKSADSSRPATVTRTVGGRQVTVKATAEAAPQAPATDKKDEKEAAVAAANAKVAGSTAPQTTAPKEAPARHAAGSQARLAHVNTVYKIQIYSCDKILKEKDPLFGGLYPVTCSKNGQTYHYYYGESASQGEIYRLLSDVRKVFPEAKVVKTRRQ